MDGAPGSRASIIASPVLVGAVTVLIVIVGVYLAYNANNGLPFVPTYDVKAELPNGQKLIAGNEIRLGGFRVGVVSDMRPVIENVNGTPKAVALVTMKLDASVRPLAADTQVRVRPRSALGLKYLDILPGRSKRNLRPGDTIPLSRGRPEAVEYEDLFSTFDKRTRDNSRTALKGFGDAFAGRGASINEAIQAFNPFFVHLTPVMRTLSAPATRLRLLFRNIDRAAAQVAPAAATQARLFGKMARTFDAFSACSGCLQQTIEKSPPTLRTGADSFAVQRPFLSELTTLSRELRPTVATLHTHLGTIDAALETGIPVLARTPALNRATARVFQALDDLARNPATVLALEDLHLTFAVLRPLAEYVAPYNTVCDNGVAFFTNLADHISENVTGGTSEVVLTRTGSPEQDNGLNANESERPADVPSDWDPQTAVDKAGNHLEALHNQPFDPAVDAHGNADCQTGQRGYLDHLAPPGNRYGPAPIAAAGGDYKTWEHTAAGGSHVVTRNDSPGLMGGSYVARRLGIENVRDVP